MANGKIRRRLSAVAVAKEPVPGQDAFGGSDPALSAFIAAQGSFVLSQRTVEDPSYNGSFDAEAPFVAGLQAQITLRVPIRGAKTVATAPEWGVLAEACRMEEVIQAAAIGAPTAATAGTDRALTLAAPFVATAGAYNGMPIILSDNPAAAMTSLIIDYSAARVAVLADGFSPPLSAVTKAQIPPHVLYRLVDDETLIQPVTIYGYEGGLRHKFVGCVGSMSWEWNNGAIGFFTFTLRGQILSFNQVSPLIPGWNDVNRVQPPLWKGGKSQLNRMAARCLRYAWDGGVQTYDPENPEAEEAYDPPDISGANQQVTIDPFASTASAATLFSRLKTGNSIPFGAIKGSTPGNRVAVVHPSLRVANLGDGERGGFKVDQLTLVPMNAGAGTYIAVF